jgi:hypothetical protein
MLQLNKKKRKAERETEKERNESHNCTAYTEMFPLSAG